MNPTTQCLEGPTIPTINLASVCRLDPPPLLLPLLLLLLLAIYLQITDTNEFD